jgi:large subunit ribosomal protein L17
MMRHRNNVKQLGRTYSHRKAMFTNMVTSLFMHEKIITTKQKGKELKRISERLISRAKRNLELSDDDVGKKLHNKRIVMKTINNRDVIKKLFDDIAIRFKDRRGGYIRLYLLGRRNGDAAEMAIVELVERKVIEKDKGADKKEKKDKKDRKRRKKEKETIDE